MIKVIHNTVFNDNKKLKTFDDHEDAVSFANALGAYYQIDTIEESKNVGLITSILEFKKIFENIDTEYYYIIYNKITNGKLKKHVEVFSDDQYNEAIQWGRENVESFNPDMVKYGTHDDINYSLNENIFTKGKNWIRNKFSNNIKDNAPEYTPDPIPADADWWTENDVFVFGSNTQGHHSGGAAKAAMLFYGAIWGQARGLQGQSYGIVTLDYTGKEPVTLETIGSELDTLIEFAKQNPDKRFWMTKIGTGISRIPFDDIASLFKARTFPKNIKLPKEFSL